jgi:predicted DNA-binding protein
LAPSARGGRRDSPQRAHYTAQVIAMVEPGIKERVRALAEFDGVSDSAIMREIIAAGLPAVERARTP